VTGALLAPGNVFSTNKRRFSNSFARNRVRLFTLRLGRFVSAVRCVSRIPTAAWDVPTGV